MSFVFFWGGGFFFRFLTLFFWGGGEGGRWSTHGGECIGEKNKRYVWKVFEIKGQKGKITGGEMIAGGTQILLLSSSCQAPTPSFFIPLSFTFLHLATFGCRALVSPCLLLPSGGAHAMMSSCVWECLVQGR